MSVLVLNRKNKAFQYSISVLVIAAVVAAGYVSSDWIGYKTIALILLLAVSALAILFDIWPVLLAACLSALAWNFLFIPPKFTFHISSSEDALMLLMYFVVALINAVLTYQIRSMEKLARERQEKANAVKLYNTLLNSLSHELRTPIATVIAATDNLLDSNEQLLPQHRHELLKEIAQAGLRLNQQVENLLNMSRLDAGVLQPKKDWCDIAELLYQTVEKVNTTQTHQIHIQVPQSLPFFKTDKILLEQVLLNLLQNAIQYTPAHSSIQLSAHNYADLLHICIEDNGPGFPEQTISYVFDKFYRLQNSKAGGTGLGLSIVKGFTEALGGTVTLTNHETGGACFTIRIPAEASYIKNLKNE
jgi:two-component system sensor histidine kinase KdpD